jgi:thiamine-monophosphate kinase
MNESDIIARYFRHQGAERSDVRLGVGDDAAVMALPAGMELVATTDSLVEGAHFLPGHAPHSLGHKALAVNLSDCAAMGAQPAWALLSLSLPEADEPWLSEFATGFSALARAHGVALVGGNLTRGPLSITVQLLGLVRAGRAVLRSGAQAGDLLCITGSVGDAAAALSIQLGKLPVARDALLARRFDYPEPRVALGQQLGGLASACIDISDGVYADVQRLVTGSRCGAVLNLEQLPLSDALRSAVGAEAWRYGLYGGEDYELVICVAPERLRLLQERAALGGTSLCVVGELTADSGLKCLQAGCVMTPADAGFDHFR